MHNNKIKWCMHKDEIVLNTTKKKIHQTTAKAYPMVVTTLGDMRTETKDHIKKLYASNTPTDFYNIFDNEPFVPLGEDRNKVLQQIKHLPEFRCQGIALGQAFASYMSGDTVASVLVGGMMTVLNGHFTMCTGDEVQWYFDFESCMFDDGVVKNGTRLATTNKNQDKKRKQEFFDERLYGASVGFGKSNGNKDSANVARVKSYRMTREENCCFDHYGDKIRIFAKCISGGRAFDMVDIMLMTQSS